MDHAIVPSNRRETTPLLASRRGALAACRTALDFGPVLLTGAAGVGKTWLLGRLADERADRSWVSVDCAPGMTPEDFLYTFSAAIGLTPPPSPLAAVRVAVDSGLREARDDGRPIALTFDEAHLASDMLLEEIRLIANRMGMGRGLASLVICGQTPLARRLDSKSLAALETRLAARVHLLPLDLAEASTLLTAARPGLADDREVLERMHRDSGGNPARLLRLANRLPLQNEPPERLPHDSDSLVPTKPPLRVEDGLIEVGWDSESDPETEAMPVFATAEDAEEPVEDHYAALQAWDEWARNQGRFDLETPLASEDEILETDDEAERTPIGSTPGVWAEGKHGFGPYSQLFSRMKPASRSRMKAPNGIRSAMISERSHGNDSDQER